MNSVILIGRLTRDPELHIKNTGEKIASFTIIVHRPLTRDICDFIDCVARNEKADFVMRNFKKGSVVEVRGITTTRTEEPNRKVTECRVDEASFGRSVSYQ